MRRSHHKTSSHQANTPPPTSDDASSSASTTSVSQKPEKFRPSPSSKRHSSQQKPRPLLSGKHNSSSSAQDAEITAAQVRPEARTSISADSTPPRQQQQQQQQQQHGLRNVRTRSAMAETLALKDISNISSPSSSESANVQPTAVDSVPPRASPTPASPKSGTSRHDSLDASLSPSLDLAFNSPATRSQSTVSTESTGTVRGTASATPFRHEARTPSYPFPYMPRTFSSSSALHSRHQPFTSLSPTAEIPYSDRPNFTARDRFLSQSSIPGSTTLPFFAPSGSQTAAAAAAAVSDFPSDPPEPNLYDIVLQLNCESTLGAWWESLAAVMNECYAVNRMCLSLPADPSDENVPWAQKASYNVDGVKQRLSNRPPEGKDVYRHGKSYGATSMVEASGPGEHTGLRLPKRPPLEFRHSYSGSGIHRWHGDDADSSSKHSAGSRPPVPRSTSYTSSAQSSSAMQTIQEASPHARLHQEPSCNEPGLPELDVAAEAKSVIYPTLRALDREDDPLLDTSGVSRVLDRAQVVTLTREYKTGSSGETSETTSRASPDAQQQQHHSSAMTDTIKDTGGKLKSATSQRQTRTETLPAAAKSARTLGNQLPANFRPLFEEYEQFSASPWSQSPAPSPAIQNDAEVNPFFASVNEDSFNPTPTPDDYSHLSGVEAIGVDNAATILHIPLVHPLLSKDRDGGRGTTEAQRYSTSVDANSGSAFIVRKLPIAILSILSPYVPYTQHLLQSIRLLAPHLATSFNTSYQNTTIQERITGAVQRQQLIGRYSSLDELPTENLPLGVGLDSLLHFTPDENSSTFGSLASPSDYSSISRYSPIGSTTSTPNPILESSVHPGRYVGPDTPNQPTEATDDYFNPRKRGTSHRAKGNNVQSRAQLAATSSEHRSVLRHLDSTGSTASASDKSNSASSKDAKSPTSSRDDKMSDSFASKRRLTRPGTPTDGLESHHTVLHSHGADFNTSFQSLPATTAVPRPSGALSHSRNVSSTDAYDMPPPSERLLRIIIDSLPVQIFTAGPISGDVTWVNSKFLVYRGQSVREVLDNPWSAIHPDDLEDYNLEWRKSLQTGQQFQHKVRLRRFDNNFRWYYVRAAPLRDKMQNLVHWVGTMIDLHDQHIAEVNAAHQQETAASEAKYRALANSSPQIVFAASKNKGIIFCNTQWVAYSGQSERQARGMGFTEHVHPDDLIKCQLPTFDDDGDTTGNIPVSMPPEPHRTWSGFVSTSSEESGESSYTLTGVRSTASSKMQLPQHRLSALASTGILRVSKDAAGKASYSTEVRLRMKNGEYRWHLVRVLLAEPLIHAENEEETWYGTCTDINDHKELEQTLKETMNAKSRFLSNMSHEIRTPLNGIHGMATFLIDSNLTPEQLDQVNIIRASTEGLRDLINDILDLSKVEAGMITLNMDWFHARSVIEEVNDLTSPLAIDKNIELNYLVEETVPFVVKGDKFRFRQVLLNVIGNAIKFTQKGEVFVRCKTLPQSPREDIEQSVFLQIDVIDTGNGFSEEEAERLFKRFSQIDGSSTRQHGGSGLGLVISMQLVELHGGTMTATSTPMKGSTFTFTMKFGLPEDSKDDAAALGQSKEESARESNIVARRTSSQAFGKDSPREGSPRVSRAAESLVQSPVSLSSPAQKENDSGSLRSSASSDPSLAPTARTGSHSTVSSQSSFASTQASKMALRLPSNEMFGNPGTKKKLVSPGARLAYSRKYSASVEKPALYSILVVCPLKWTREAVTAHLESVLSKDIPHNILSRENVLDAQALLFGEDAVTFTHVVLILRDSGLAGTTINEILQIPSSQTSVIVITDMIQKKEIISNYPNYDFDELMKTGRVQFVSKPIKPSRLAPIFDPTMSRQLSTDINMQSAQQMAENQRRVFDNMSRRLGNKDNRVLLVEDNEINQMVMRKLLRRVSVAVETAQDGIQATDAVFSHPAGYYSIILLDLMMPNKDGYQTCHDIRVWERENDYSPVPIVALSANVFSDAWQKCKEAGFNSYLTKPVEFSELSDVMTAILDPEDPSKPIEFMGSGSSAGHIAGNEP